MKTMGDKLEWLPIDTSILPVDLSLNLHRSRLVRIGIYLELVLAIASVVGALFLSILPADKTFQTEIQATNESAKPFPTFIPPNCFPPGVR